MARIIAITNQKGGVGKTTTSVNLAASLASTPRKVLLIDLDPQGNATTGSGVNKKTITSSSNDLLLGEQDITSVRVSSSAGYDLIPANSDLTVAEVSLLQQDYREGRLKKALNLVKADYDFIFIDCPPSLSMLTINALVAADGIFIPMQCEYYALEGLDALLETIKQIRSNLNSSLEIEGILRTMYDPRNRLSSEVSEQLLAHFGDKVYRTCIPRNVRLAEAPSHGLPVLLYDKSSQGASAYLVLAGEMLGKQKRRTQQENRACAASDLA